jgi:hypothetical protein
MLRASPVSGLSSVAWQPGQNAQVGVRPGGHQCRGRMVGRHVEPGRQALRTLRLCEHSEGRGLCEARLAHPLRPSQQPGMMDMAAAERVDKRVLRGCMPDDGHHDVSRTFP